MYSKRCKAHGGGIVAADPPVADERRFAPAEATNRESSYKPAPPRLSFIDAGLSLSRNLLAGAFAGRQAG